MSRRRLIGLAVGAAAAVVLWFAAVDRVWYEEDCLDCQSGRTIRQVRVATVPLRESIEERPSLIARVADDLGAPCPHARAHRWLAERRLGLVLLVVDEPVLHESRKPWYPPCARDEARALARREPGLAAEFRSRVLSAHDWGFWTGLRARLFDACPPDQRPDALIDAPGPDAPPADESPEEAGPPVGTDPAPGEPAPPDAQPPIDSTTLPNPSFDSR